MRRFMTIVAVTASTALLAGGVAIAESQTVAGDKYGGNVGDITKMTADNGSNAITVRIFGLGKPCGGTQSLTVDVKTPLGKTKYFAQAGCYGGTTWLKGLWYTPTGAPEDGVEVTCAGFELGRGRTTGVFRVVMPRSCLTNAPNKVKIEARGNNFGSATGGHAGPTTALVRG